MDDQPEQAFRRAMSAFATGVTVVSAARADGRMSGITVNSLTSVSLQPRLLLWCLGDQSERYDLFAAAETWGVTVLSAGEQDLALRFARAEREGIDDGEAEIFFGAPVLRAGLAHLACRTHDRRLAGDHLIIIGEVTGFRAKPGDALTFYRGLYGRADDPRST
ncbi:MAG TPA: flavin reductase family protein [Vitreimonas sp.]|uniref:flavin reductase family protein n=1 Tax=Vitreimonas sp. TaxID=3069702 RepID=UPI002D2D721F|nr:flavin reductase family protein [Vitreimonas sp.]HYD85945.1 flavin reductase family protein [Vitreimonas sp.]